MKRGLFLLGLLFSSACFAQSGYNIGGKVKGLDIKKVYLVSADFGKVDTLSSTSLVEDRFILSGNVPGGARAVVLKFVGVDGEIPIMLENTNYQISITPQGAAIEGEGPASKLLKDFERIGTDYATEKNKIEAEFNAMEGQANSTKLANLQSQLDNAYKQSEMRTLDLIKANAESYVSAYVLALNMAVDNEASLRTKYDLLDPLAKSTVPGKAIESMLNQYEKVVEGETAPNYTLTKPDGNTFSIHGLPAKWKILHFWAANQQASRKDNADLVRLYLQYRPKGIEIISISLDDNASMWKKCIGLDGMTWVNGSELQGMASKIVQLYLIKELPAYVVLDVDNCIVARDLSFQELREKIADLTKKKKK